MGNIISTWQKLYGKIYFTEEFHLFIEQKHKSFMLHIPQVIM